MLTKEVYEAVLQAKQAKRRKPGRYIHPSSLECVRRVTFELMGFPAKPKIDPGLQAIMDLGNAVHDIVEANLETLIGSVIPGAKFEKEIPIDPETNPVAAKYFIRGRADGIGYEPEEKWVLEIKSVGINKLTTISRAMPEHKEQVNTYMALFDIPAAVVMYVARENLTQFKLMEVKFDQLIWEATVAKIDVAVNGTMENRLPPTNVGTRVCQICPYRYACTEKARWIDAAELRV